MSESTKVSQCQVRHGATYGGAIAQFPIREGNALPRITQSEVLVVEIIVIPLLLDIRGVAVHDLQLGTIPNGRNADAQVTVIEIAQKKLIAEEYRCGILVASAQNNRTAHGGEC